MSLGDNLPRPDQADLLFDLINAFALVNNPVSSAQLLQDLLTPTELRYLSKRLRIAKLLLNDEKQEKIMRELHCSYGTIAKVSAWLEDGGDGFKQIIKQLPKRKQAFKFKRNYFGYGLPQILVGSYLTALSEKEQQQLEEFMTTIDNKDELLRAITKVIEQHYKNL